MYGITGKARISLMAWALLCSVASARMDMTPLNQTVTPVWAGGDITVNFPYCISSTQPQQQNRGPVIPYSVNANIANTAAPFELSNGVQVIPFSLAWQDTITGISTPLNPNVTTLEDKTGVLTCPGTNNGQLTLFIASADLVAASPGTYSAAVTLRVENSGTGRRRRQGTLTIDLTLPDSIRVTQLTDINLGLFDGVNDLAGSDDVCVYRKSGGSYAVTLSGSGVGGAFELANGASRIPYTVTWNGAGVGPGATLPGQLPTYTADEYCNSGAANNAVLGVSVLAADILANASADGAHIGVLSVVVQSE